MSATTPDVAPDVWDDVAAADPEVVAIAPCGFSVDEAVRPSAHLDPERVAPNARHAYYARPGPRLADGVRQLGYLLHPHAVADPRLPMTKP